MRAVDGASFSVPDGSITAVVGESGCGKTTLGRALMGVMAKTARIAGGEIVFAGRDIVKLPASERRAMRWRDIAFIPQSAMSSLDPVYRIGTQLSHILVERGGLSRAASRRRAEELFAMIGIEGGRLADFPHQFSGGMRQRVAIAMALALEPRLIIADEPVTALDVIVQRQILDVLRALRERLGISVILITHDISVVAYACDRMAVMYAGRIVEEGPVGEVLQAPAHPYTMGLANAFPDLHGSRDALIPIHGEPPDLHHPPAGCRFRPRCPFVLPVCARDVATTQIAPAHDVACWRHDEALVLRHRARELATWELATWEKRA
ncbi:MAG TPA: ABC transporter ATP-binding protein [Dongiaceae bacterium]